MGIPKIQSLKLELIQLSLLGNNKRCRQIAVLDFDHKDFSTNLNSVSPGPLSRKLSNFLFPLLKGPVTRLVARYEMAGKSTITKKGPETAQSARELAPCCHVLLC